MGEKKILIIEDNIIVAMEIKTRVLQKGYTVTGIATSGPAALLNVKEYHPDLALVDINLKGDMDGIETVSAIRSSFYDIAVIYITAYSNEDVKQRASATHPVDYLTKPFEPTVLMSAIERALGNSPS